MNFLRHVGMIGDRKVAIVFRELPGEEHMALVVYTQLVNKHVHDAIISVIESDIGQSSESLADALNRTPGKDGRYILQVLHLEGMLKKVQTDQVIVMPNPKTRIKLNELNKMLNEMKQGEAAIKRMAEIDESRGLQDPADIAKRKRGETPAMDRLASNLQAPTTSALDDASIVAGLRAQAQNMETQAKGLLAESKRLLAEADALLPKRTRKPYAKREKLPNVLAKTARTRSKPVSA